MKAIILTAEAGQGNLMCASLQTALQPILGKPMVQYVIESVFSAGIEDVTVVDDGDGMVQTALENVCPGICPKLRFAPLQNAFDTAGENNDEDVLILCGNMPFISGKLIRDFMEFFWKNKKVALSIFPQFTTTNVFMFKSSLLSRLSAGLDDIDRVQNLMGVLHESCQYPCAFEPPADDMPLTGVFTQVDLAEAVRHMQTRINTKHMLNGVRMINPQSVYIDDTVEIAQGVVIYPNVILEGKCEIHADVTIGANSHLKNTVAEAGVNIRQSVIFDAVIGAGTEVGPFAYLRQDAKVGSKCRIGNFVEIKNSTLDDGVKAAHLAYIGDARLGKNVNYSCGAITANYDGKFKHPTVIGDDAFIGSNATLIAPVTVGENALVAAGSTITDDLQGRSLGIARARQVEKLNWVKP